MHYLFIVSGPGGVGKDTIINRLIKDHNLKLQKIISHTSRAPRQNDVDGRDYYFLTKPQFEHEIEHDQMLEYEVMEANNHYYGTQKQSTYDALKGNNIICNKMPAGALALKKHFGSQAVTIFLDADNQELEHRLLENNRSMEHTLMHRRLKQAEHERELKDRFDYCVINHDGQLDQAVSEIKQIIVNTVATH